MKGIEGDKYFIPIVKGGKIIKTINPSANNPANYIKKMPFIMPDKVVLENVTKMATEIVTSIKEKGNYDEMYEIQINNIFKSLYGIE